MLRSLAYANSSSVVKFCCQVVLQLPRLASLPYSCLASFSSSGFCMLAASDRNSVVHSSRFVPVLHRLCRRAHPTRLAGPLKDRDPRGGRRWSRRRAEVWGTLAVDRAVAERHPTRQGEESCSTRCQDYRMHPCIVQFSECIQMVVSNRLLSSCRHM